VLQSWLLPVLKKGLGSSFNHVFGRFSSPLALFSRSTLGDMHAAGRFQSSLWGEEEGKSMQPVLEKMPFSLSLLHLYPS
jgi:hypothetical protein